MKYPPGSFSKNFAWHGTGLLKLHTAICRGFQNRLEPVERQSFRNDSGLDGSLSLIPINFFLHNHNGRMSVDELVFRAIEYPHSTHFDRLGLFSLHLNKAGSGDHVVECPIMWANEFVRECLWSNGTWQSSALQDGTLDPFFEDRVDAKSEARLKCRSNYRHLFELCKFWPSSTSLINSGAEQWIMPALFLAWDRHILNGGLDDEMSLLKLIDSDELYKLLGANREYVIMCADNLVEIYIDVGRLARFQKTKKPPTSEIWMDTAFQQEFIELPEESGLGWLEQQGVDEAVERRSAERQELKRDRKKAAVLKQHYDNTCMFCGTRLQITYDGYYSEAAHIKGLGEPHNGPDKISNMLVLCPNHHLQFDRGVLRLYKEGASYRIKSKIKGDPLHGKAIALTHPVDEDFIKYHHDWVGQM